MQYEKTLAFHCHCCGGLLDIRNAKCDFCGQPNSFRTWYFQNNQKKLFRLFVKAKDGTRIYLHEANNISTYSQPNVIEATTLSGEISRYYNGRGYDNSISVDLIMTKNLMEKIDYINTKKGLELSVESDSFDKTFNFTCDKLNVGMPDIQQNSLMTVPMIVIPNEYKGLVGKDEYVDDGCTCPNCGGVLRKRFGLCDYCGGWVEQKDYWS